MQTIQFIETVQWIESQFSPEMIAFLIGQIMPPSHSSIRELGKRAPSGFLLGISHELARKQFELESHPFAKTVLQAFELGFLLKGSFPVKLAKLALGNAEKEPNEFGLYDLHGNVQEWVEDGWHNIFDGAPNDGRAWIDDSGGGWPLVAQQWRSAFRGGVWFRDHHRGVGLRLARTVTLGWSLRLSPKWHGGIPVAAEKMNIEHRTSNIEF